MVLIGQWFIDVWFLIALLDDQLVNKIRHDQDTPILELWWHDQRKGLGHGLLLGLVVSVVWYCTRPNNDGEHIVIWIFHVYIYIHIIYVSVQCVCAYVGAPAGHPSMKFRTRHNWCPFLIQILVLKQPTAFQHGSKWPYISMIVVVAALLCKWIESQLISQLDVGWLADCWSHIVCFLLSKYMGLFECLKI